jgi:glutathione peroxidase
MELAGLEGLYRKHRDNGFMVLGFPCSEFDSSKEDSGEAKGAAMSYPVTFPIMDPIFVSGDQAHPLYQYLMNEQKQWNLVKRIKGDCEKFLIDRDGQVIDRFSNFATVQAIDEKIQPLLMRPDSERMLPESYTGMRSVNAPGHDVPVPITEPMDIPSKELRTAAPGETNINAESIKSQPPTREWHPETMAPPPGAGCPINPTISPVYNKPASSGVPAYPLTSSKDPYDAPSGGPPPAPAPFAVEPTSPPAAPRHA